ncbi:E3 ubiquitin-protein ligase RBBP6-like isoform X1 [Solea senegalensis]|uniref:E3 ubiquitin-protein ligase RBBP6-like isoform X1 n=2 Tax=Solea senegalensis TaxID=28829 RepID=A0AAV6QF57_SOLSE|nr:E3 ubiquitin-protein ligase RBBP6-like isoform X1 [Solea senegalensis]
MSSVHYKFSSKLDEKIVTFDGLHITLKELKRQIMSQERLKATNCNLQIRDAQTGEEFTDDETQISKNSSVIVCRTPTFEGKPAGGKSTVSRCENAAVESSRTADSCPFVSLARLAKTANLVAADASEEDKIKAMMFQSNIQYDTSHFTEKAFGPPPANYICFRCLKTGHHIRQCPMVMAQDKSVKGPKKVKTSKGIPRSFLLKVTAGTKGAMLTSTGEYVIPAINAEAYAQEKKERPPFVPDEKSSSKDDSKPVPYNLLCPLCNDLVTDAVVTPCCGNACCDECIRNALLDSEEHICFICKQTNVSPDDLIANEFLRQTVDNYKNETGYMEHTHQQVQHAALETLHPLSISLPYSRQQDPLVDSVPPPQPQVLLPLTSPDASHITADTGQDVPVLLTVAIYHHSPEDSTRQAEPLLACKTDPEPCVTTDSEETSESGAPVYHLSVIGQHPATRPPHPSGHQSRLQHCYRHWKRSNRRRGESLPTHLQTALPQAPALPVYPPLYHPPPQSYPPPYPQPHTSCPGFIAPPTLCYQTNTIYAAGPQGFHPPWMAPGSQAPRVHLTPSSQEDFFRQQQDKVNTEFTIDYHKELMEYKNIQKRRRRSSSRSRSNSHSPLSCSYTHSKSRSRSRSYSRSPHSRLGYEGSRIRSCSRSDEYRLSGSPLSPPSYYWDGSWERAEGAGTYRWRPQSRSPGSYWSCSHSGWKPPLLGQVLYKPQGPSVESEEHSERERFQRWERNTDWYDIHYNGFDNQNPPLHHKDRDKSRGKRRDYSSQERGRREREERGAPPHHPPFPLSSGIKSHSKAQKIRKLKKRKARMEPEPELSHPSADKVNASYVRDIISSPSNFSKSLSQSAFSPKASAKTQSDKTLGDNDKKLSVKVKTVSVKVKKRTGEKKERKDSSFSSPVIKPLKTMKAKPEDALSSMTLKQKNLKSSTVRSVLLKTSPMSSHNLPLHHPSVPSDIQGRRDLPPSSGLLSNSHQHELPLHYQTPSLVNRWKRKGEEGGSLSKPPGKWRISELGADVFSHQLLLHRLRRSSDRPGLLPLPGSSVMSQGDSDRETIRPMPDLPTPPTQRRIKLTRNVVRRGTETPVSEREPSTP